MIAIVTLLYVGLVLLVYKVLKIRPNPKNVACMVVIGFVLIGAILLVWQFASPMTKRVVVGRYTIALIPQVGGPVTKIHAKPNVPLKAGADLLFEIQRDTYQNTVKQLTESLKAARRNINQLEAAAIAAEAAVEKAVASRAAAEAELTVANKTAQANPDAISRLTLQQLEQQFNAADAAVDQAQATAVQAKIGRQAAENTAESLNAQLANAQFNLDQCKVYAPADGFVTNWAIREGTLTAPQPNAPVGTFVDSTRVLIGAPFPQNLVKHIRAGDAAELTFKTRPGEVFAAEVDSIVPASGEGQLTASGNLPSVAEVGSQGMLLVKFRLKDQAVADSLAMGTAGTGAIYTSFGKPFHVISKVTVRLNAWMYYLIPV